MRRARALVPVLVPLFVGSFRRADDLALAMEARCFVPGVRRSRLHPLRARWPDGVLLVVVAAGIARAHGGGIEVETDVGRGSTLRLFVPVFEDRTPSAN